MPLAGKAAMVNWLNVPMEHRKTYQEWQGREHMALTVAVPGFQRGRRHSAVKADRDVFTCYEVDGLHVLTGPDYRGKVNAPSPLTQGTAKLTQDSIRGLTHVKASIGSGLGGFIATFRFDFEAGREAELERHITGELMPQFLARDGIVGLHFLVADIPASSYVSVERKGRSTVIPSWVLIAEGITAQVVEEACDAQNAEASLLKHGGKGPVVRGIYVQQMCIAKMPNWLPEGVTGHH